MENENNPNCEENEIPLSPQPHLPIIVKCEKEDNNAVHPTNARPQTTTNTSTFQAVVPVKIKREIGEKDSQLNIPQPHKPIIEIKKESSAQAPIISAKNATEISNQISKTANVENVATLLSSNELDSITAECLEHVNSYIDAISAEEVPEKVINSQRKNSDEVLVSKPKKESNSDDEEQTTQSEIFTDDFFSELYTPIESSVGQEYVDEATAQIEQHMQQATVGIQRSAARVDANDTVDQVELDTQIRTTAVVEEPVVDANFDVQFISDQSDEDLFAQKKLLEEKLKLHKEKTHKHKKNKKKSKRRRRKSDSSDDDSSCHKNKRSRSTEIISPVMVQIKDEPLFERRQNSKVAADSLPYMSSKQLKAAYDINYCEQKYDLECLAVNPLFAPKTNNLGFKPIKLEKLRVEPAKKTLTMQELKPHVKRLSAQINKVMKLPKGYNDISDGLLAARIMEKINLEEKDLVNRSLLALNPITKYSFNNSSTHIDYKKIGLEVLQTATARLATLLGYDMRRLKERLTQNQKLLGKKPIDLSDKSSDAYSFLKDAATQTNVADKTGISVGVEAKPSAFNIGTQTTGTAMNDANNSLPLMQFLPKLNDSQVLAVNDFVELLLERKMGALTAHESYQTRQRLFDIYNSAEVNVAQAVHSMNRNRDPRNQTMPYIEAAPNNSYHSHPSQNYAYMPMSDQITQPQISPHYNQTPDHQHQLQRPPHYSQYGHNNPQPDRNFQNYYARDGRMPR